MKKEIEAKVIELLNTNSNTSQEKILNTLEKSFNKVSKDELLRIYHVAKDSWCKTVDVSNLTNAEFIKSSVNKNVVSSNTKSLKPCLKVISKKIELAGIYSAYEVNDKVVRVKEFIFEGNYNNIEELKKKKEEYTKQLEECYKEVIEVFKMA